MISMVGGCSARPALAPVPFPGNRAPSPRTTTNRGEASCLPALILTRGRRKAANYLKCPNKRRLQLLCLPGAGASEMCADRLLIGHCVGHAAGRFDCRSSQWDQRKTSLNVAGEIQWEPQRNCGDFCGDLAFISTHQTPFSNNSIQPLYSMELIALQGFLPSFQRLSKFD